MAPEDARRRSILLVEDEALIALGEKNELERYGYAVTHVLGGEDAVRAALEEGAGFDLILMDINLGAGMDGTRAAAEILERRDVPVVFLSSYTERAVVEKTEGITSYGYVVKNTGITVLDAAIKMALKLHAANRALRESEERYKTIVASMSDLIFVIDEEDRFIDVHYQSTDDLLLPPEEFLGKKVAAVMPANFNELYRACAADVRLTGENRRFEYSLPIKGETRWFVASLDLHPHRRRIVAGIRDITDRKKTEDALREREERLRFLAENMADIVWTLDRDLKTTYVSPSISKVLGFTPEERMRQRLEEMVTPASYRQVTALFAEELRRDTEPGVDPDRLIVFDVEFLHADCHTVWMENHVKAMRDADGAIVGIYGSSRDISERKRAEEVRKESEQRYRELYENLRDGSAAVDTEGRIIQCNQRFLDMLGYTFDEVKALTYEDITPARWHAMEAEILTKQVVPRGYSELYEKEYIHKDKRVFPVELQTYLVKDAAGNRAGFWAFVRDISERKRVEETLGRSEERYRSILEAIEDGYYEVDLAGNFTFFNDSLCRMMGYPRDELMGMNNRQYTDRENLRKLYRAFNQVYKTGKPLMDFDWEVVRKDGTPGTGQASISLIRDSAGAPCGFRGIARDITERKRAEDTIKYQLKEKEILLKEVHHRIKNNIASIAGMLRLMASSTASGEAKSVLFDAISRVESMQKLYQRLLLAEDYRSFPARAYINDLLESIIGLFPQEQHVTIRKHLEDFSLSVKQLFHLGLIINELITNSVKYAFDGSKGAIIDVSLSMRGNTMTLTVRDNGKGLPDGFDPDKSAGFGLMLVKMLALQLNGVFSMVTDNGTKSVITCEV